MLLEIILFIISLVAGALIMILAIYKDEIWDEIYKMFK